MPLWLEHLSAPALDSLLRESTVFFLPVSALEDHGPHLPLGLDLEEARTLCRLAAEKLENEKPGWKAVIAPAAPLATECNTSRFAFPVRGYVLRDYLVDFGNQLLQRGFKYVVVFTGNPSPRQLVAIEEASKILARRSLSMTGRLGHWLARSKSPAKPALVCAQAGGTQPGDILRFPWGADPIEHGGARDTSVALWLYRGTPQAPQNLPLEGPRNPSLWHRKFQHARGTLSGFWGNPSKASTSAGQAAVEETLAEIFPKLRAWLEGSSPSNLFRSWHSILPSNRTTFRAWLILVAIAALFAGYLYLGMTAILE